jgi:predicted component of type VI protein secretion system
MRVTLNVIAGPQTGRAFTFDQHETFTIGRSEDSQFCLPHDRYFSRNHCLLEIAPPQTFLRDLGSTNGTFVNGLKVETAHLKNGDRIQGGETVLEVEVSVGADETLRYADGAPKFSETLPSLITVQCLNCGIPSNAEASRPDAKLSFLCDGCREKLRQNRSRFRITR